MARKCAIYNNVCNMIKTRDVITYVHLSTRIWFTTIISKSMNISLAQGISVGSNIKVINHLKVYHYDFPHQ